jgi:hypothetical protein
MTTNTITEADVVTWLCDRAEEHSIEFGGYGVCKIEALFHRTTCDYEITFTVGAGKLNANAWAGTLEAARELARKQTPESIAAKKRAEAARLLAEADKLEGKS